MEKVRPRCGQPSDRGRLRNRPEQCLSTDSSSDVQLVCCSLGAGYRYRSICSSTSGNGYQLISASCTHSTHTHTFNGPFSGTTWVRQYQKGKTNLDFTETRDSGEWQWHPLGHMQVCTSLQTDNHHSVFYRPDALPTAQPTASKH